jgi:hypothetical protein
MGELRQRSVQDVSKQMLRIHEVVARIQVTGVLESQGVATGWLKHAQPWWSAQPGCQRDVEDLHVDAADVSSHPVVENGAQEGAVLLRSDGAIGDLPAICDILGRKGLDNGNELNEPDANLVAQVAIDVQRVGSVGSMNAGKRVVANSVGL